MPKINTSISFAAKTKTDKTLVPPGAMHLSGTPPGFKNQIAFTIRVEEPGISELVVKIDNATTNILQQKLQPNFLKQGSHAWVWQGQDNNNVLSTSDLLGSFTISLIAKKGSVKEVSTLKMEGSRGSVKWIDAQANLSTNTVSSTVRLNIKDGGGEHPPKEVQNMPSFKNLRANDPRRTVHVQSKSFVGLRSLGFDGIKRYWSRTLNSGSAPINVSIDPVQSKDDAMDDIKIIYNTNDDWKRSSNPGTVRGLFSFFGQLVGEKVAYNVGWNKYSNGWGYIRSSVADDSFRETFAHEIGHEILGAIGGERYSYGHKGSSTVVTQSTKDVSKGGVNYPPTGDIDLMKYYNGPQPTYFYSRVKASEKDVAALFWLARVEINEN